MLLNENSKKRLNSIGIVLGCIFTIIVIIILLNDPPIDFYGKSERFVAGEIVRLVGPDPVISYRKTVAYCLLYGSIVFGGVFCVIRYGVPVLTGLVEWIVNRFRKTP